MANNVGIIAGTGFYTLPALENSTPRSVNTKYGQALVTSGVWGDVSIEFVTRHGVKHTVPPSMVNYRANIQALKDLGVTKVIAINVVGSIDPELKAGDLQIITDFIDFTSGRESTFFDGTQPDGVKHTDVVDAYDVEIGAVMTQAGRELGIDIKQGGVYAGFNGPRFETPAEIRLAALAGATVVGMTGCPEATLACEAGLRYAAIALSVNPAAGVSNQKITMEDISKVLTHSSQKVIDILQLAIQRI
jgi:5'-deoxy-5'-methylthioadenosine phosphorylase